MEKPMDDLPSPKKYVLDTNVILHDSGCIYKFEEHDIIIPITVLEELDHFKKGNESLNYHAREFLRSLDELSGDKLLNGGVKIGKNQGDISIKLEQEFHSDLMSNFDSQKRDHRILNIAYTVFKECQNQSVILVSKDVNLRMKAKSIGIKSENYLFDHVKDIAALYKGHRVEENQNEVMIDALYQSPYEIELSQVTFSEQISPNEFFIMRKGKKSALATYNTLTNTIQRVDKRKVSGITPRNAEQTFALNALLNENIRLVTLSGKAGTGKTLLALAAALEQRKSFRQIFLARPIVPLSNKDIGYLPGDINAKLTPYMKPLFDNLNIIENHVQNERSQKSNIKELLNNEKLVITPLSYIRGRNLLRAYFIVDEAQNLTPHEIKTIITRAGEGTKVVLTGDIFQIDHPYLDSHSNGLSYLIEKMQGQHIYAHVNLEKGERSELAELASNLL